MRYLLVVAVLLLAGCQSATEPSPDLGRGKRGVKCPPKVQQCFPCTVENGCIPPDWL